VFKIVTLAELDITVATFTTITE